MDSELANKQCVPCRGGTPPLSGDEVKDLLQELDGWAVEQEYHLTRAFTLQDFAKSLSFVNRIGGIASQPNHHPAPSLAWATSLLDGSTTTSNGAT